MTETKTGAIVCKKQRTGKELDYEALLFITNVPHDLNDIQLENHIDIQKLKIDFSHCPELLFRADIQSTSNTVQEQFENFHKNKKPVAAVNFSDVCIKLVL